MCLRTMSCHAMAFHMLRNMMLFMRALQHLMFFMQSYVLLCTLFHLTLIEFICIFIGFIMFHETPRPPLWDCMGWETSLNYWYHPNNTCCQSLGPPWGVTGTSNFHRTCETFKFLCFFMVFEEFAGEAWGTIPLGGGGPVTQRPTLIYM